MNKSKIKNHLVIASCFVVVIMICFTVASARARTYDFNEPFAESIVTENDVTENTVATECSSSVDTGAVDTGSTMKPDEDVTTKPADTNCSTDNEKQEIQTTVPDACVFDMSYYDYVDFGNSISKSDIPSFSTWDVVGYVTCKSAGLDRVPITYNWSQQVCDACDIVMDGYSEALFGQGRGIFICGHNYKALSGLKNAKTDDYVLIETVYGANYLYKISFSGKAHIVEDPTWFYGMCDDVTNDFLQKRNEDNDVLGIFTCLDMHTNIYRWYVRAELVKGTKVI